MKNKSLNNIWLGKELKDKLTGFYVSGKDHPADMYPADDYLFSLVSELLSQAHQSGIEEGKSELLEEVRSIIENERFIECLDDILDLGSNGINPKEELLKKLSILEGKK